MSKPTSQLLEGKVPEIPVCKGLETFSFVRSASRNFSVQWGDLEWLKVSHCFRHLKQAFTYRRDSTNHKSPLIQVRGLPLPVNKIIYFVTH